MDYAEGTNSGTDTARKPDNAVEVDYGTGRLYRNVGFYEYPVTSYKFLNPGRLDADEKYKKNQSCPLSPDTIWSCLVMSREVENMGRPQITLDGD